MAPGVAAKAILDRVALTWRPFRDAAGRLGVGRLEEKTPAGWTAKEMLATVAFWDEAAPGWITIGIRGQALSENFTFGSGFASGQEWPAFDIHNAREAEWGRSKAPEEVVARCDAAHEGLLATLATVTDEEAKANRDYFGRLGEHYADHQPELDALLGVSQARP